MTSYLFINKIWPEFAKLLPTCLITIHEFHSIRMDWLNNMLYGKYKFTLTCHNIFMFFQSINNTCTKQSCVSWALALEGPGAERHDTLPNIISCAFNLFQTDIGGNNFTSNRRLRQRYFLDGRRPAIFYAIYEFVFLPALRSWILIGTSVWVSGEDRLPLCNVASSLFGLKPPDDIGKM